MESEIIKMRRLKRQLESTVLDILNIHNKSYIRSDDIDEIVDFCKKTKPQLQSMINKLDYFVNQLKPNKYDDIL